jgi:hypothetical protein
MHLAAMFECAAPAAIERTQTCTAYFAGRPLPDIRADIQGVDLVADAQSVLDWLVPVEREPCASAGICFPRAASAVQRSPHHRPGRRRRVDAAFDRNRRPTALDRPAERKSVTRFAG